MNKIAMAAVAAMSCALAGCIAPAPNAAASAAPEDVRITVSPDLCGDVCVTDVRCVNVAGSVCPTFQANMVNNTGRQLILEWKVQWLDKDGMEIDSIVSRWNARALQAYEVCALKSTAPTSAAVDMRFYVRRGR